MTICTEEDRYRSRVLLKHLNMPVRSRHVADEFNNAAPGVEIGQQWERRSLDIIL